MAPDATIEDRLASLELVSDPYPLYGELREHHPVYWSQGWNAFLITRYDDVVDVLRREPRDDILSALVAAHDSGEMISEDQSTRSSGTRATARGASRRCRSPSSPAPAYRRGPD